MRITPLLVALLLVLAACSGAASTDAASEPVEGATAASAGEPTAAASPALDPADAGETTLYSGRDEELVGPILDTYESEGGQVATRYGDSAELALLIEAEGPDAVADAFLSQSPGATGFLAEAGRLRVLPDSVLEQVDERFRSASGRWVGITARQRVLVYNTDLVDEADLPDSVLDVTEMPTEVAIAPANGSFQDFVTALRLEEGEDVARQWLEGMVDAPAYANNSSIVEAVSRGEVPMGLVNHYYAYQFLADDPDLPIANHVFAEGDIGSILIPSAFSVVEGAPNPAGGEALASFLLSPEAQEYFANAEREYPLVEGVPTADNVPPLDVESAELVDVDALGENLSATIDLIREAGLQG